MKNQKIIIATGGTGGHIYPAITLAKALQNKGHDVSFIGNKDKMEATLIPQHGFAFYSIVNRGLVGNPIQKIMAIVAQIKPMFNSKKILKQLHADKVVVFGGYVSIPVGFAAVLSKIPLILHEQNAIPGLANKILAPFAKAIAVSYPHSVSDFKHKNVQFTGNPRGSLMPPETDREAFFNAYKLSSEKKTVLFVMGSQGSETVNEVLKQYATSSKEMNYQIILVTGKNHYKDFISTVSSNDQLAIVDHIAQTEALHYVDAIVCRGGATTVSEVIGANIPALFIPSPYVVKNHQYENIKPLLQKDAAMMIKEQELTVELLKEKIDVLLSEKTSSTCKENMRIFATENACKDVLQLVINKYE